MKVYVILGEDRKPFTINGEFRVWTNREQAEIDAAVNSLYFCEAELNGVEA